MMDYVARLIENGISFLSRTYQTEGKFSQETSIPFHCVNQLEQPHPSSKKEVLLVALLM